MFNNRLEAFMYATEEKQSLSLEATSFFRELQERICTELERIDGKEKFRSERWDHPGGGGGDTRIMQDGAIFEKGGVNFSAVEGFLHEKLATRLGVASQRFFATGISLVLHPSSPMIPTVHLNLRYLSLERDSWFGGGTDLTPYYLFEEDVVYFHSALKRLCDAHNPAFYPRFKKWCDEYFFIKHRGECRGVGGIFFDYLREEQEKTFSFIKDVGNGFLNAYAPIVERRKLDPWGDRERQWQSIRRSRYVEFNLVYDRGTLFGLETEGRAESILMSLPPVAHWKYGWKPEPGSKEATLQMILQEPREWAKHDEQR